MGEPTSAIVPFNLAFPVHQVFASAVPNDEDDNDPHEVLEFSSGLGYFKQANQLLKFAQFGGDVYRVFGAARSADGANLNVTPTDTYILKKVPLGNINEDFLSPGAENPTNEVACLEFLKLHPHINVNDIREAGVDGTYLYIVLQVAGEEEVGDYLETLEDKRAPLVEVQNASRQLLGALCHLHSQGICHRDISAKNVMTSVLLAPGTGAPSRQYKMIDFGMSLRVAPNPFPDHTPRTVRNPQLDASEGAFGSVECMAPEILRKDELVDCFKGDVFALGSVLCLMAIGVAPILQYASINDRHYRHVCNGPVVFAAWIRTRAPDASDVLIDFLYHMLQPDQNDRPTAAMLAVHPWLFL